MKADDAKRLKEPRRWPAEIPARGHGDPRLSLTIHQKCPPAGDGGGVCHPQHRPGEHLYKSVRERIWTSDCRPVAGENLLASRQPPGAPSRGVGAGERLVINWGASGPCTILR